MRVVRGRPHSSLLVVMVLALLLFVVYQGAGFVARYGSLFYIETFLPSPPLPHQRRVSDTLNPRERTDGNSSGGGGMKVLCVVVTAPQYHQSRARHVKETWLRHCNRAVFLSSEADTMLGEVVVVPQAPDYGQLWDKVIAGFEWAVEHLDEFEWLVKADDDTFILVENLKNLLQLHDHDALHATGLFLRDWATGETYLNGGAGYAVSRRVVREVTEAVQAGGRCTAEGGMEVLQAEDLNMAACFKTIGVSMIDSLDQYGRQRFHVYPPSTVIDPRRATDWNNLWLKEIPVHPYKFGFGELSSDVISFHYVDAEGMYLLYYLVYLVNPRHRPLDHGGNGYTKTLHHHAKDLKTKNRRSLDHLSKKTRDLVLQQPSDHRRFSLAAAEAAAVPDRAESARLVSADVANATLVKMLARKHTKAVFGITRNKKYNYFYRSADEYDKDGVNQNNFKKPEIERIGVSDSRNRKWKINNNKDVNGDHSTL